MSAPQFNRAAHDQFKSQCVDKGETAPRYKSKHNGRWYCPYVKPWDAAITGNLAEYVYLQNRVKDYVCHKTDVCAGMMRRIWGLPPGHYRNYQVLPKPVQPAPRPPPPPPKPVAPKCYGGATWDPQAYRCRCPPSKDGRVMHHDVPNKMCRYCVGQDEQWDEYVGTCRRCKGEARFSWQHGMCVCPPAAAPDNRPRYYDGMTCRFCKTDEYWEPSTEPGKPGACKRCAGGNCGA